MNSPPELNCDDAESFQALLLEMARQRSVDSLLRLIVRRLCQTSSIALARLWLIQPGDICQRCVFADECPDRSQCLHLVASDGESQSNGSRWDRLDGRFQRFPIGVRKVGHIAATGDVVEVTDISEGSPWIVRPEWATAEGIRGFVGQPLVHQSEVLGVLGVFLRSPVWPAGRSWLRIIADHAAVTIANTRALQRIEHLTQQLELENEYLKDEISSSLQFGEIVGQSAALQKVLQQVALVAPTDSNVLILGESGVGKELIARAIHQQSPRHDRPLIKVNCASIPRDLFESEFFGHTQGAFTGAVRDRVGRFELADGGTLFLDEIGEVPLEMQSKLLRVLQEGTYERIGEEQTRQADVRIVAATNRDLQEEAAEKNFREDLYYRLSVFPIEVVPLRQRVEDIPLLASHFLQTRARQIGVDQPTLKQRHVRQLMAYRWPGNIRELQNVIERAVIRSQTGPLQFDLPQTAHEAAATVSSPTPARTDALMTEEEIRRIERQNMIDVLEAHRWKISGDQGAAQFLGLHPATLSSRMRSMGIRRRTK
ncbi:sigma-54-dependent Fis family transcriptional regulator [Crateriforma conspicua]|uniref:Formate hydrogenlyase transcriptional activator n=1 Tax=Crateriforma conspicua TaxID=2527996 RepID=A0A5C5Y0F9_9PLAN|nr:sigma 54-interacting transcriptional regulator [Crateriforma conspicua]QDV62899.1 Formate hydrogenlyase transcriptional activator [Crateriforma conspicua]TWT68329.1 Formate hydrogenlyase transcriptional activator [Crateriforma conspicua]